MKIAHIAPPWLPLPPKDYGGTENVLFDLIEEQTGQGHDVTLFAPGDARTSARRVSFFPRSLRAEGVPWTAHLKAEYHLRQSLAAVEAGGFEIVHTHLSSSADLCLFPLLAQVATPHLTTLHSRFPFDHVPHWTGDADEFYLQAWGASVPVVTISEQARRDVPPGVRVVGVVHNGLSMKRYVPASLKPDAYLMWLGRFVPEKGAHAAIEVAKRANRRLVLAGIIDRGIPESVRYFHEEIEPHIDQQQIRYVGSATTAHKITLLTGALGLLNPITWEEPFGMVMIEAMAMGCPVISFARGAAPELLVQGHTGFLVHTVDEMVQCIPHLALMDRAVIRSHVEAHFSARAMADNYVKVYHDLIGEDAVEQKDT
jgi:glycosyltransferase involved in cell wall biosynthesis